MAFTREDLASYEKGPQTKVPDSANPFRGSTPAKAADAGAVAAVASGQNLDATPGGTPAAKAAAPAAVTDDSPVVDEDGTLGDPTDSGEGTSDVILDSSTETDDPGTVADPNADLIAEEGGEEPAAQAPAKGSAQERIVELNDKLEGATIFGKTMQEQLKIVLEENARIRAERSTGTAAPAAAAPPVVNDDPGPMPDMADADVEFDNAKYRAKMQKWATDNAAHVARKVVREVTGVAKANSLMEEVNTKVDTYAKANPKFKEVVTDNPVLRANQLAPAAGLAVARSPYTAELLMRFGNDSGYAIRVAKMSPEDQLLEVGELIAAVKAEKKGSKTTPADAPARKSAASTTGNGAQPVARKSTQAPPPPRATQGGGASQRLSPLDPNMRMEDFVREHRTGKESARKENRKLRGLS